MKNLNRLSMHLAAAAVAATAATSASAAIVHRPSVNITIPVTTAGVYLNVVTGVFGTASGAPGWDVNPWGTSGLFVWGTTAPGGGVVLGGGTGTAPGNLPFGTSIGPANTYGSSAGVVSSTGSLPFILNSSDNLVGFRFTNEGNGQVHYGWMRISVGAAFNTAGRTIVEYAFEDQPGVAIQAGAIPTPGAAGLLALGGLVAARRRRA